MSDLRDKRQGAYDPAGPAGFVQPEPVKLSNTPDRKSQPGADVRPDAESGRPEDHVPAGLREPRLGPLNKNGARSEIEP